MTRVVNVYSPMKSVPVNFQIAVDHGIWGWRGSAFRARPNQIAAQTIQAGDVFVLGHGGVQRQADPLEIVVHDVCIGRVTRTLYQDTRPIWADDVYENRIDFTVEDRFTNPGYETLGHETLAGLQQSANRQSGPYLIDVPTAWASALNNATDVLLGLDGDLDVFAWRKARREQSKMRIDKFGNAATLQCALCEKSLSAQLIHAAHIRPRASCPPELRRNMSNVMPACILGCDALFEYGYVGVDEHGVIHASARGTADTLRAARALDGRRVSVHAPSSAIFFSWHWNNVYLRTNHLRAAPM